MANSQRSLPVSKKKPSVHDSIHNRSTCFRASGGAPPLLSACSSKTGKMLWHLSFRRCPFCHLVHTVNSGNAVNISWQISMSSIPRPPSNGWKQETHHSLDIGWWMEVAELKDEGVDVHNAHLALVFMERFLHSHRSTTVTTFSRTSDQFFSRWRSGLNQMHHPSIQLKGPKIGEPF